MQSALCRFIPASAGNALAAAMVGQLGPVHPRECGERPYATQAQMIERGSSPRVRGTHAGGLFMWLITRFIPASAGNATPS